MDAPLLAAPISGAQPEVGNNRYHLIALVKDVPMVNRSSMSPRFAPLCRLIPALKTEVRTDGQWLALFVETQNASAFAELVRLHGAMVLGVCRRVIGDSHLADDAFQTVFLVLARRAGTVQPREQIGNWLYGVAYRTALKARALHRKQLAREGPLDAAPAPEAPRSNSDWHELRGVLDTELARLPDKLRLPIVLCDLEGRSQRDVAKQFGIAPSTLASRIGKARELLAQRLTQRGITLSATGLTTLLTSQSQATVHPLLAESVLELAVLASFGGSLVGVATPPVIQLTHGVLRMMLLTKLKAVTVGVLAAVLVTTGLTLGTRSLVQADDAVKVKPSDTKPTLGPALSDEEFLKRVCLDLRGTAPSSLETGYFVSDGDQTKRKKVVGWLSDHTPVIPPAPALQPGAPLAPATNVNKTPPTYIIDPPDVLYVTLVYKNAKLPAVGHAESVRPDGNVVMSRAGKQVVPISVAGKTCDEAAKAILEQFVKNGADDVASAKVDVLAYNSKYFFVVSDVLENGAQSLRIPMSGTETVLDAMNRCRFTLDISKTRLSVYVERHSNGNTHTFPVDWDEVYKQQGKTVTNYQILPHDRIHVKDELRRPTRTRDAKGNKTTPSYINIIEAPDVLEVTLVSKIPSREPGPERYAPVVQHDGTIYLDRDSREAKSKTTISVAGKTCDEAAKAILEHLAKNRVGDYSAATVDVLAHNSKYAHVIIDLFEKGEQVVRIPITGTETVLDVLKESGLRFDFSKSLVNVWISRRVNGVPQILTVDWEGILKRGDTKTNYTILPQDRLYIQSAPPVGTFTHFNFRSDQCTGCHQIPQRSTNATWFHSSVPPVGHTDLLMKWAIREAYNREPTRIEQEYFNADVSASKLDTLFKHILRDPELAKKLGSEWQTNLTQPLGGLRLGKSSSVGGVVVNGPVTAQEALQHRRGFIDQLIASQKSDPEILDLLAAMNWGRLPTEEERKVILASVTQQADRRDAWKLVADLFHNSDETRKHAGLLTQPDSSTTNKPK